MAQERFEVVLDGVPYAVMATPFEFNDETRYRVSYNGKEHIFTYDPRLGRLAPIDDDAFDIPDNLEAAIAQRLRSSGRPAPGSNTR
ncbi:MAG TPA: hypothetical protein VFZ78_10760 [Flavisolibacter sp.]